MLSMEMALKNIRIIINLQNYYISALRMCINILAYILTNIIVDIKIIIFLLFKYINTVFINKSIHLGNMAMNKS